MNNNIGIFKKRDKFKEVRFNVEYLCIINWERIRISI